MWDVLEVGLLRSLAALGFRRVGELLGISTSAAAKRFDRQREAMCDEGCANIAALTARDALEHCDGRHATAIAKSVVLRRVPRRVEESA